MTKALRLKKNEDRRLIAGHLWIYSNEVDIQHSPLKDFIPGELVHLENSQGKFLGMAYINPHSLICARILSRNLNKIDKDFFRQRLQNAIQLREQLYHEPYYRLVFGESDGLPGIVIDRYNDVLVMQTTTAGMENFHALLADVLHELLPIQAILLRNDTSIREMENLPQVITALTGSPPQEVLLHENECEFMVPIWNGQKTGWFYDHRANRTWLKNFTNNKRVLDVFSYLGGWGIPMARAGAASVTCIDSSATALSYLNRNAIHNKVHEKLQTIENDAFIALQQLHQSNQTFDIVIIDPPAFIKSRKHFREGFQGYQRLNELALKVTAANGWLVSASCSMHLSAENLTDIIRRAGIKQQRKLKIIMQGHQSPDHPVHPAMPETRYLKMFVAQAI
jgi:23S rRNA (cytosine1962-C5)-methyltransferase